MGKNNYCLIKKNKIYEELYEILEDENLIMDNPDHKFSIKYKIEQLLKTYLTKHILLSETFENTEQALEDFMLKITTNTEEEEEQEQGNTLLLYANMNSMYEVVFMEKIKTERKDEDLNQLVSISNIELSPIYGSASIIKTLYTNGNIEPTTINFEDINELFMSNFYHKGIMIQPDNKTIEIEFAGENPNLVIGGTFKMLNPIILFDLSFVGYVEESDEKNEIASIFYDKEIKGRLYLTVMCPLTKKRFWNVDEELIKCILKLIEYSKSSIEEEKNKIKLLQTELNNEKLSNPFYLIKKYCV